MSFFLFDQHDFHHNDVDQISDRRILVQRRHHIHDGQQIHLDVVVLVEGHHCGVRHDQRFHIVRPADGTLRSGVSDRRTVVQFPVMIVPRTLGVLRSPVFTVMWLGKQ